MSEADLSQFAARGEVNTPHNSVQPLLTPGAQLRVLREERAWSIEQVADQLKLAPRQVDAIEADNYAALPGMAVTRGFIRAYAKLLRIDATPLLDSTPGPFPAKEITPTQRKVSEPFVENHNMSGGDGIGRLMKWAIWGAFLLLIVTVFAVSEMGWLPFKLENLSAKIEKQVTSLSSSSQHNPPVAVQTQTAPIVATPPVASTQESTLEIKPEASVDVPKTELPSVGRSFEAVKPNEVVGASGVANVPTTAAPATTPSAITTPPPAPAVVPASPVTSSSSVMASKDQLVLQVREESWVEIKQVDRTLIARIVKAGEALTFDATSPIFLTIGNSAGVDVTLRGKSVELKSIAKNNVARLSLK